MLSRRHSFQNYQPGGGIYRQDDKLYLSIAGCWGSGEEHSGAILEHCLVEAGLVNEVKTYRKLRLRSVRVLG
jgi:hypothetical protein